MKYHPSNILFRGEAETAIEALHYYAMALQFEGNAQSRMDTGTGETDGFTQSLLDEAQLVRTLIAGMPNGGNADLFARWATSADERVAFLGDVCLDQDFTRLAI